MHIWVGFHIPLECPLSKELALLKTPNQLFISCLRMAPGHLHLSKQKNRGLVIHQKSKYPPHIYRLEGHSETWPWAIRTQGAPREGRCFVIAVIMRGSNKASGFQLLFRRNQSEICFCCLRFVNIGLSAGFSECFGLEVIYLELKAKSSVCPGFSLKTNNLTLNISSTPGWVIDHGFFLLISSINKQIF